MSDWKRPDPIPLPRHFHSACCRTIAGQKIAVASFRGEASNHLDNVYPVMDEAIGELLDAEMPAGLIIDFRALKYSWGDEMARILFAPNDWYGGAFPVVVIVSDLNREGLTSLVRDEMFEKPEEWLAETEEAALRLMKTKLSRPEGDHQ